MDEEKTIDEAVEEQADEMKEFEPVAFDEVIKDEPVKESAPVLRDGGDPDPADMNMIHKHLDNFLAMLCGETPIDDNVRNSTEYWLKRLADGNGGSTKKIYIHPITIAGIVTNYIKINNTNATGRLSLMIFNNNPESYTPAKLVDYINYLYDNIGSTVRMICSGLVSFGGATYVCNHIYCTALNNFNIAVTNVTTGTADNFSIDLANLSPQSGLFDDGVNAIN